MKSGSREAGSRRALVGVALFAAVGVVVTLPAQAKGKRSDITRCDRHEVADVITRQLQNAADFPATKAILPANNPSANYYHMVLREPLETPAQRFYYGSQLPQFGDLRLPKGRGPHPVAIVIHGGAWGSAVSLHYTASLSSALTCAGVATWNIEYRRIGGGGGWPQTFQDVGAAADFLRDLATRFPLDLSRVVATGHSAGGHLSPWLAARHRLRPGDELYVPNPLPLRGVVPLAGPADLARFMVAVPRFDSAVRQLFGGGSDADIARHMKEGSPAELLPLGVPQIFINGDKDPSVPIEVVQEYAAKARAAGDSVQVISVAGGHFESPDPALQPAGRLILESVLSLLGVSSLDDDDDDD
jgi:acetyl esterase/lipase